MPEVMQVIPKTYDLILWLIPRLKEFPRDQRYMDDLLLFGASKGELHDARMRIEGWLERERRLHVHPRKTRVLPVRDGVPFVGSRVFPGHVRLDPGTGRRFVRRLRRLGRAYSAGEVEIAAIGRSVAGWVGHARHGTARGLVSKVLWEAVIPPRRVPAVPARPGGSCWASGGIV